MATIYRFIVENKYSGRGNGGRKENTNVSVKGAGKKGINSLNVFSSEKHGVEHNRRMRAINPLLNKVTGGYWEKGMRVGRAGMGFARTASNEGVKTAIGGVGFAIIIAFVIQQLIRLQNKNLQWGKERNTQNFKQMETGISQVHGEYTVVANAISGRRTYNENK